MKALRILGFLAPTLFAMPSAYGDDEPTALDVAGAPTPGNESGRSDTIDESDGTGRLVLRGVLFVPRAALAIAFAPIEGAAWAIERYQLVEHGRRLFWNDAGTFGVMPTVGLASGFGADVGARLVHLDLFGEQERVDLRAKFGGRWRHRAAMKLSTGMRFDPARISIGGEYDQRDSEKLYAGDSEMQYRHRVLRATSKVDVRIAGDLHVRAAGALADHELDMMLDDVRNLYGELEVRWDSRRAAAEYEPRATVSTGTLLAAFGGRATALDNSADFYRYGFDAQQFFRLATGPRVLSFRVHGEAVSDEAPMIEQPSLGGDSLLRGYASDRFRDRAALVGTAEYAWDLTMNFDASLFVDYGRTYEAIDAVTLDGAHFGYGIAFDFHTQNTYLARASIASSTDGGVFFNFALDPAFALDERTER